MVCDGWKSKQPIDRRGGGMREGATFASERKKGRFEFKMIWPVLSLTVGLVFWKKMHARLSQCC